MPLKDWEGVDQKAEVEMRYEASAVPKSQQHLPVPMLRLLSTTDFVLELPSEHLHLVIK